MSRRLQILGAFIIMAFASACAQDHRFVVVLEEVECWDQGTLCTYSSTLAEEEFEMTYDSFESRQVWSRDLTWEGERYQVDLALNTFPSDETKNVYDITFALYREFRLLHEQNAVGSMVDECHLWELESDFRDDLSKRLIARITEVDEGYNILEGLTFEAEASVE